MRVLFIGNSFTQRNDLPGLIAGLAAAASADAFESDRILANGASLRQHWNAGEALKAIEQGGDLVVLQEQSTLPVKNRTRFHENVRLFVDPIRESGAGIGLYQTWARQHAPETQEALNEGYNAIGEEIEALVIPVGEVWQRALTQAPELPLYDKDGSHPSALGSYLAACVFFAALYKQNPVGLLIPAELKIAEANGKLVQELAAGIIS